LLLGQENLEECLEFFSVSIRVPTDGVVGTLGREKVKIAELAIRELCLIT
jgi:hypothetical protein